MPSTLVSPSFAQQNTTATNDMSPDGYTWASVAPLLIDKFGKLVAIAQRYNSNTRRSIIVVSNNLGSTWSEPTRTGFFDATGEGFVVRAGWAYDSTNDILHVLWSDENSLTIYRRYTFTRDGSNNITGVTRDSNVNLQLDPTTGTFALGFPQILWIPEGGTFGSVLCLWVASNSGGTPNKTEIRATMRVLSNSSADNTAGNWVAPVTADSTTNGIGVNVAYSIIFSSTSAPVGALSAYRKQAGTNALDVYVSFFEYGSSGATAAYKFRRMRWASGSNNWSTGLSTTQTLSLLQVAGSDTGYSLKDQLTTKWAEDTANDLLYIGFSIWKDNTTGDTVSFKTVNAAASDAMSSRVDVYSAGGAHSTAPTLDLMFDPTAGVMVFSYIKTSTQAAYIQTFHGTTPSQAETLVFNTATVDIPLLNPQRVNGNLAVLFRDNTSGTPPYHGWYGTMAWSSGIVPAGILIQAP